MEGYTSEREQLEQIKKWWDDNGKAIVAGLTLGLLALFGYRYWDSMLNARAESASINYQHFLSIASPGISDEAREAGDAIISGYPKSTYARLTALLLAKLEVDANQLPAAKQRLQWVLEHAGDGELATIARARLAQIMLAEGDADGAWAMISQTDDGASPDQFAEIKGDIFAARGQRAEAAAMYQKAQAQARSFGGDTALLELKLDSLGGTPPAIAAD